MAGTIVNLTLLKVNDEIENILENFANPTYQQALNDPDLRQKIIAYVLSRIPNRYLAMETEKVSLISSQVFTFSTQENLQIEQLIHQGIAYLCQRQSLGELDHTHPERDSTYSPSHWFG